MKTKDIALNESSIDVKVVEAIALKPIKKAQWVNLMPSGSRLITCKKRTSLGGLTLQSAKIGDFVYVQTYGPYLGRRCSRKYPIIRYSK